MAERSQPASALVTVLVTVITTVGVITAALFTNWDKVVGKDGAEEKKAKVEAAPPPESPTVQPSAGQAQQASPPNSQASVAQHSRSLDAERSEQSASHEIAASVAGLGVAASATSVSAKPEDPAPEVEPIPTVDQVPIKDLRWVDIYYEGKKAWLTDGKHQYVVKDGQALAGDARVDILPEAVYAISPGAYEPYFHKIPKDEW